MAFRFRVLVYNVFFLWQDSQPERRAPMIAEEIGPEYDALVFLEAFAEGARWKLLDALRDQGYKYATAVLGNRHTEAFSLRELAKISRYAQFPPMNGGVLMVSKWPFQDMQEQRFSRRLGIEFFSSKGFVYGCIGHERSRVHLLAVHAQADEGAVPWGDFLPAALAAKLPDPAANRTAQCQEARDFIDSLQIPETEPIIIAGDFNIDSTGEEFEPMLRLFEAVMPPGDHAPTVDLERNDFCCDPAREGFEEWLGGRPVRTSRKTELVDYVLCSRLGLAPTSERLDTVRLQGPTWPATGLRYDLSDHFAVRGEFAFGK